MKFSKYGGRLGGRLMGKGFNHLDALFFILVIAAAILALIGMEMSYATASFQVAEKSWETTTQLAHDETDWDYVCDDSGDCEWESDTRTVIDQEVKFSGRGLDPVYFHQGFKPTSEQYIITHFGGVVVLIYEGERISISVKLPTYEKSPLGAYCYGEIGWFNSVRRLSCGGR